MSVIGHDSLKARRSLDVDGKRYDYFSLDAAAKAAGLGDVSRLPFSLKVLLENLVRLENGRTVTIDDIKALGQSLSGKTTEREIAFRPARVLMQDLTGVPAVVDLAAMRAAMVDLGGDPNKINPLSPVDLVIDHSVQIDNFGTPQSFAANVKIEFERNSERYRFLRWGQQAFENFRLVPPGTGICHQVNLEYLSQVVWTTEEDGKTIAYPDTLVGTDSHTTMVNGLAVLGWGVGGIEAEAAMLGQPISMLIPEVVGMRLTGKLREGATATDLVLTITQMLRRRGVVGRFVEYLRPGHRRTRARRPRDDRQHGAGIRRDLRLLPDRRRDHPLSDDHRARPGAGQARRGLCQGAGPVARRQYPRPGVHRYARTRPRHGRAVARRAAPAAGPGAAVGRRGGVRHRTAAARRRGHRGALGQGRRRQLRPARRRRGDRRDHQLHQHLEPERHAGRRARRQEGGRARAQGQALGQDQPRARAARWSATITPRPGCRSISTSSASTSSGYGCTTCIGNSGPLPEPIAEAIDEGDLAVCAVLSGNRNFEGRIHAQVRANYLASPPLVVAYALAGSIRHNLVTEPLGEDPDGKPVYLQRHLAEQPRGRRHRPHGGRARRLPRALRQCVRRAAGMARRAGGRRHDLRFSGLLDLSRPAALFREHAEGAGAGAATSSGRASWRSSATASPPTISRPPAASRPTARPANT